MKQIRIKIRNNGSVEAETLGMKGADCLKYLQRIEEMANATTVDSRFTEEYYESQEILTNETAMEETLYGRQG